MKIGKLIIIVLFLASCNKEDPVLLTDTLNPKFKGDTIFLNGEILSLGQNDILQYGFVLSKKSMPVFEMADSIILCNDSAEVGKYSVSIVNDIDSGFVLYLRSFAKTSDEIVYGKQVLLKGIGRIAPKILGFIPESGFEGDYVKVQGLYFGYNNSHFKMFFGESEAEIIQSTNESIIIEVPSYDLRKEYPIIIKQNNHEVISSDYFLFDGPKIIDFSPTSGMGNISLTIYGENFAEQKWRNTIMIEREKAEIIESSTTQIKAIFNTINIVPGQYNINIQSIGVNGVSEVFFEVYNPWAISTPMPSSGLASSAVFEINNNIYLCTGTTHWGTTGGYTDVVFAFDTETKTWTQKANFPGGERSLTAGFSIGNKAYLGTGKDKDGIYGLCDFWEYDPFSDKWQQKNDVPGGKRIGAIAFSYNSKGYVLMGSRKTDFWIYEPTTDSWGQLPDFPGHQRFVGSFTVLNDKLYVIGGVDPNNPFDADIWEFNLITQQWTFVNYLDVFPIATLSYNGKCYIIERKINHVYDEYQTILYEFDLQSGKIVSNLGIYPGQDIYAGSFAIIVNGIFYFGAGSEGFAGDCLNDVWTYPLP